MQDWEYQVYQAMSERLARMPTPFEPLTPSPSEEDDDCVIVGEKTLDQVRNEEIARLEKEIDQAGWTYMINRIVPIRIRESHPSVIGRIHPDYDEEDDMYGVYEAERTHFRNASPTEFEMEDDEEEEDPDWDPNPLHPVCVKAS